MLERMQQEITGTRELAARLGNLAESVEQSLLDF